MNLVSIIIPSYNRAHLLGATLDSILNQTHRNWECVVVDDCSTDYTPELMEFYCSKDYRIQFHQRSKNGRKGANTCRNIGFQRTKGEFIQWFDSDDIMNPQFLEIKIRAIENTEVDFVLTRTANFQDPDPHKIIGYNKNYYCFQNREITHYNYVTQQINWLTPDFFGKRELCEKVEFNEKLKSAQERNFFSKLTLHSVKVVVIDKILTLRRVHKDSTQARFNEDDLLKRKEQLEFYYETWKDIRYSKAETVDFLFNEAVKLTLRIVPAFSIVNGLTWGFIEQGRLRAGYWFWLYQLSMIKFQKGTRFRRNFLKRYKIV